MTGQEPAGGEAEATRQVTKATGVDPDLVALSLREWERAHPETAAAPEYWRDYKAWAVPILRLIDATKCPKCWGRHVYGDEWARDDGWIVSTNLTFVPTATRFGEGVGNRWHCSRGDGKGGYCLYQAKHNTDLDNTLNELVREKEAAN